MDSNNSSAASSPTTIFSQSDATKSFLSARTRSKPGPQLTMRELRRQNFPTPPYLLVQQRPVLDVSNEVSEFLLETPKLIGSSAVIKDFCSRLKLRPCTNIGEGRR